MRKILIGLTSLAVILAIFMVYSRLSKRPPLDIAEPVSDSNIGDIEGEVGKIGDVGVVVLKNPQFIHRNKNKEVDRIFGFKELVHQVKDQWEIEKPYLNIYQNSFKCFVTADKGEVQIETAVGKPTPKDATFSGNVLFHILPQAGSDIKESFIYLDDISFISDRTLFFTEGPVKFTSQDASMLGKGFELIYNDELERLEYLRIVDLKSLHIKGPPSASSVKPQAAFPSTGKPKSSKASDASVAAKAEKIAEPNKAQKQGYYHRCIFYKNVMIDSPEQLVFADGRISIEDIFWAKGSDRKPTAESVDVNVGRPGQGERPAVVPTTSTTVIEPNEPTLKPTDIVVTCDGGLIVIPMESSRALDDSAKDDRKQTMYDEKIQKLLQQAGERTSFITSKINYDVLTGDVVATDRSKLRFYTSGMLQADANKPPTAVSITAQNQTKFLSSSNQVTFDGDCRCSMLNTDPNNPEKYTLSAPTITVKLSEEKTGKDKPPSATRAAIEQFTADGGVVIEVLPIDSNKSPIAQLDEPKKDKTEFRARFVAPKIDYIASANEIVAPGPTELSFWANDVLDSNTQTPLPVTVTAQKLTRYLLSSNQVFFEGNCLCSMLKQDPNSRQKYMLYAPKLTVCLSGGKEDRTVASTANIRHLTASGDVVRLATVKTAGDKLLSGIELKCHQFDFDDANQILIATGPGVIKFTNSEASEPNEQLGRFNPQTYGGFSLRQPCWALFEDFDTLKYHLDKNRIIVNAAEKKIKIGYVPVIDGQAGQAVRATAGSVQALLYQTAEGLTELSVLFASGGVTYEDEKNQFAGSDLFYDHQKAIMKVKGDATQPCIFNGALVDSIEYNLKTGKVKARVTGPGALQVR